MLVGHPHKTSIGYYWTLGDGHFISPTPPSITLLQSGKDLISMGVVVQSVLKLTSFFVFFSCGKYSDQ